MDVFTIPVVALYSGMVIAFAATMIFVVVSDVRYDRRTKR